MTSPTSLHATLKNAPITEAVIDVRVSTATPVSSERLREVRNALASAFPSVEEQRTVEMVEVIEGRAAQPLGYDDVRRIVLRSDERKEAVLISDVGFGFSKLRPYTRWEDVFSSARKWWRHYAAVANVEHVTRVAVRYINHFQVPGLAVKKYLQAPPSLPAGVDMDALESVFSRFLLRDPHSEIQTILMQMVDWDVNGASVLIDIDASLSGRFDPDVEAFWDVFEELRAAKNRIFFGSITSHAREEFDR